MAEPYLGEIEAFPFNFAPKGWAFCAGQLLPINQNQALFALLGTTFGGNGTTTSRCPICAGASPPHLVRDRASRPIRLAKPAARSPIP